MNFESDDGRINIVKGNPLQVAAANYSIVCSLRTGRKCRACSAHRGHPVSGGKSPAERASGVEDRQGPKQSCRYFTGPAIANERLRVNRTGACCSEAQDGVTRWCQPPRDDTNGNHATPARAGATTAIASDLLSWRIRTERPLPQAGEGGRQRGRGQSVSRLTKTHATQPSSTA